MTEQPRQQRTATRLRRPGRTAGALSLTVALVLGLLVGLGGGTPAAAATGTIVSLTFDDADADQLAAATTMNNAGMVGTFYLVSGFIGAPGYMTLADVQSLAARGNEIGGHTVSHPDLTTVSAAEATRQICTDRANWANWGFPTRSFAYPFASANASVELAAKNCGYNSARGLGDVKTRFDCRNCPVGETVPPADPYYTKAPDEVEKAWTLADLQKSVTQAEAKNNGSWVQLTFHHLCTGTGTACPDPSTTPAIFNQFITWLKPRASTNGTVVKTVGEVIGGPVQPVVNGPGTTPVSGIQNPSMETVNATSGLPDCYFAGGYGTNTPAWQVVADAHSGTKAVKLTMANYSNGDAKLLPNMDLGQCAPSVTAGHSYVLSEWYKSTAVTQFAVYYRSGNGQWQYWTSSPWFSTSSAYVKASWTTPALPADATGISFGLNLFSNGTLTVDDLGLADTTAATAVATASRLATVNSVSGVAPASRATGVAPAAGKVVTTYSFVPTADPTRSGRLHRAPRTGHAPGDVVLKPFVVSAAH